MADQGDSRVQGGLGPVEAVGGDDDGVGPAEQPLLQFDEGLCKDCIDVLGLREDRLNVEFTQRAGDEMYHPTLGGYSPEWSNEEV